MDTTPTTFPPNRRKWTRTALDNLVYLNIEPDNGAILLDASDGGLKFHAVGPVFERGMVRLWFPSNDGERLEASGEVVWTDASRKTGGLRFTSLPPATRTQIWNLMGKLPPIMREPVVGGRVPPAADYVPDLASKPAAHTADRTLPLLGEVSSPPAIARPDVAAERFPEVLPHVALDPAPPPADAVSPPAVQTSPPAAIFTAPVVVPERLESPVHVPPPWGDRGLGSWTAGPAPEQEISISFGWILAGFLALVLIGAGLVLYSHRGDVGQTLIRWGGVLQGSPREPASQAQTAPDAVASPAEPAAASPPSSDGAAAPPANSPAAGVAASASGDGQGAERRSNSTPPAGGASRPGRNEAPAGIIAASGSGEEELAAAQRYLEGIGDPRSSATAAQLLWSAVAKGSPAAAFMLAKLYLSGDGVTKNCEQARVLLRAASARGYSPATQELADLNRNQNAGCGG